MEQGGEVEVNIHYTFNCTIEDRRINFFLVVENSEYLRGTSGEALPNVKDGLIRFVNQVNYLNGSCGGLTLYADQYTNRVTLRCGPDGKQALLDAIGQISVEPTGSNAGAGPAIRDAIERLPTGAEDPGATNVLFVVDAGAPPPSLAAFDGCRAAHAAGVQVMMVGLGSAGYRLAVCATNGWARVDASGDARGFPVIADDLGLALVKGQQADSAEVFESLSPAVQMQPNAQPFDPDNPFANDFQWTFQGNPPAGEQDIRYRLKLVDPKITDEIFSPWLQSSLTLFYHGGGYRVLPLPLGDICVYRTGDPSFCSGFPPPDTPTATEPLVATPSATATPTGTRPTTFPVYLPATVNRAPLG